MVVARRSSSSAAILALVVANLLPLAGVVWWGWTVLEVLVLYWLESGIVGLLNVPKILFARGEADGADGADGTDGASDATASATKIHVQGVPQEWFTDESGAAHNAGLALFFVFHYGIFWVVHGVFVFALPLFALGSSFDGGAFGGSPIGGGPVGGNGPFGGLLGGVASEWGFGTSRSAFALAVASMALSHGVSFAVNYLGRGEYRTVTPDAQMMRPYGRVMVLHVTVLFGAWLVASLGSPLPVLALLVGLKTAFDLGAHLRDHRRYESVPDTA